MTVKEYITYAVHVLPSCMYQKLVSVIGGEREREREREGEGGGNETETKKRCDQNNLWTSTL